ncbi:MAG: CoA pyrophosphatase [Gammaproteobacteria bacterium]|jgi:8-oxo-dGTP pyrophosphatase MutT (NUDIX family)|nr:CoA pyrophosphatase [Gammaproteobacteria bacterium]MDX2459183.1 CoA pyrophosphatase [Gammaproteobacteria bacterium]
MREKIIQAIKPVGSVADTTNDDSPAPIGDHDLDAVPRVQSPLTPAAVLVPLVVRPDGLQVLLTQRTDHLHDHAGQVSFPGGRRERSDAGSVETALRETREEIGLVEDFIEVVGLLDDYETGTGFRVTPVVSFVSEGFTLALDSFEVADAFEVPLDYLFDPANHQRRSREFNGRRRSYYLFEYQDRVVWGATAGMLMNLYRRVTGTA